MATRKIKQITKKEVPVISVIKKPLLIRCGNAFVNPTAVASIRGVRQGLFIVKFISEPNPEFPLWLREDEVAALLEHFEIRE